MGIGLAWRRLLCKVGFSPVRGPAAKYLKQEYQFGVAVKGGCEAVVHGVRALSHLRPDWAFVKGDAEKAFQKIKLKGPHDGQTCSTLALFNSTGTFPL